MVDDSSIAATATLVQVSMSADPPATPGQQQPAMVDDSSTGAATTVQEQPSDSIKEAKAVEVKKYESRNATKGKAQALHVQGQKEVARRSTKNSESMKSPFMSRQVNISKAYTATEKGCRHWIFEGKDPNE
nr:hypothetical protein Iba_chr03dCG3590 [Ipomoea batatas]